jgi:hypothetical protein
MAGRGAFDARGPEVSRAARVAATALLVGGLGVAVAAGALLRPAGAPQAAPAPTTASAVLASSTPATTIASATTIPPTIAATTTTAPVTTVAADATVPATTVAPRSFGPDEWFRSAVLATTTDGTVEVWTAAGQVASVEGCAGAARCSVATAVLLVDAVVVHRYDDRGASLVRLPLAGGDPVVLPAGGLVDAVTAGPAGESVWWLERPPLGGFGGTLHRWPSPDRPAELDRAFALAPGPDGRLLGYVRPPRYGDDGTAVTDPGQVVVRDLATGDERAVDLPDDAFATSLVWMPAGDRLVVQLLDEAKVVDVPADGALRLGRSLPFVATCVDADDRILGVRRVGATPTMTHELAEVELRTGRVTSWGSTVGDGTMTCRGDGAAVLATWAADGATTELRVRRADGRNTLLGRGYAAVSSPRGRSWFSSMQCGGVTEGA